MSREEFEKLPEVIELALMAERFKEKFKEFYETLEKVRFRLHRCGKFGRRTKMTGLNPRFPRLAPYR